MLLFPSCQSFVRNGILYTVVLKRNFPLDNSICLEQQKRVKLFSLSGAFYGRKPFIDFRRRNSPLLFPEKMDTLSSESGMDDIYDLLELNELLEGAALLFSI